MKLTPNPRLAKTGQTTPPKAHSEKSPTPKKHGGRIVFVGLLAFFAIASALVLLNFSKIRNAILLRFASPQVYLAYVEANYLDGQGEKWQEGSRKFFSLFENKGFTGAKANLHINHLLTSFLPAKDTFAKEPDLSGMSLLFLHAGDEARSLFQLLAQIDDVPLASLDFFSDAAAEQLFISCPQAGSTALAVSTAQDDPFVMLLNGLGELLQAFEESIYSSVFADPYAYLLPYLDVVTDVTMERGVPVPASDVQLTGTRLKMLLSLDTALDIAAGQLAELKNAPVVTDSLLPCYELSIRLLRHIAARYPANLGITAYVDGDGNVLGHEFSILSEEKTLLSLTGILTPSLAGGKRGELTFFSSLAKQPMTILLSVSQLDFDQATGFVTGKVNISCDRLSTLRFQLLFGSENQLPKLSLFVRALGVTVASLELMPTNQTPASFPNREDYTNTYRLEEFPSFLQSLDFSAIRSDFYERTGISFSPLPFSLK